MDILFWIVFGLVAGTIANILDPRPSRGGILGSILLGIVGAVVGGYLGSSLFGVGVTGFNISSFVVAIAGSMLMLLVGRMLTDDSTTV
ncbi:MAG: GlsB/YeaQ/YmgE family stress response membrane protein [Candidatus Daviesbacteria bacterium]|nr:GlsB/YeaQ/YmgE family stress response membrane protein [Candidatus Daviesbacteria bacterium]